MDNTWLQRRDSLSIRSNRRIKEAMPEAKAKLMRAGDECRTEFEAKCKFMLVDWSLEWDKAGFYAQLEADRAYTWFKLGFDLAKACEDEPVAS
jgi:hypothetical protein